MPLTPVPLTVQNLGVLLVGLLLGSRRGFAALALYLVEGAVGLPVFSPSPGLAESRSCSAYRRISDGVSVRRVPRGIYFRARSENFRARGDSRACWLKFLLFAGGLTWLYVFTHSLAKAAYLGLYWFLAAEVIKVMFAAGHRHAAGAVQQQIQQ